MLKQVVRTRLRRAEADGPGVPALAFLGFVAMVVIGVAAVVSWLVWSSLGVGVGITGGVAIVVSAGLFVWSETARGRLRAATARPERRPGWGVGRVPTRAYAETPPRLAGL